MIEKDSQGRCTLTIKVVDDSNEGEWMAKISDQNFTKVKVSVVGKAPIHALVAPLCETKNSHGRGKVC